MIRENQYTRIFSKWPFAKINTRQMQFFSTREKKNMPKFVRLRYIISSEFPSGCYA